MTNIKFNTGIERKDLISEKTVGIILDAAKASKNTSVLITSGIRSAERQAKTMYDNLKKGVRISYATAGRQVVDVYDNLKRIGATEDAIFNAMVRKINELSDSGKLVSKHCVSEEEYKKKNVVDVSKSLANPRDFVKELIKNIDVVKVITPFASDYKSSVVSVDASEPAIHLEIMN
jgi:hypothetical protein